MKKLFIILLITISMFLQGCNCEGDGCNGCGSGWKKVCSSQRDYVNGGYVDHCTCVVDASEEGECVTSHAGKDSDGNDTYCTECIDRTTGQWSGCP